MKDWIKNHPCLNIKCLEREAELPRGTLEHAVNGRRNLTQNHIDKLTPVLERYGYKN